MSKHPPHETSNRRPDESEAEYRERFEHAWEYSHEAGGTDEPDDDAP